VLCGMIGMVIWRLIVAIRYRDDVWNNIPCYFYFVEGSIVLWRCGCRTVIKYNSLRKGRNYHIGKKKYSASHSRVAPENIGLRKEQKYNIFVCHTCNEVRLCVLGICKKEVGNTKRYDKDNQELVSQW
jgi:hypothetical protein